MNSEKMERRATENATRYMNKTFGTSMSKLLKDIGDRRPNNPIEYLATQLDRMDTEEERSKQHAKSQPKSSIGNESERRDSIDSLDQEYLNLAKARNLEFEKNPDYVENIWAKEKPSIDVTQRKSSNLSRQASRASLPSKQAIIAEANGRSIKQNSYLKKDSRSSITNGGGTERRNSFKSGGSTDKAINGVVPKRKETSSTLSSTEGVSSAPSSVWSYNSYKSSDQNKRSLSLNALKNTDSKDIPKAHRRKKKRVPTVAMSNEDYKKKRGINAAAATVSRKTSEDDILNSRGRKKHRQKTSFLTEDFDIKKHFEKSKKMRDNKAAKQR